MSLQRESRNQYKMMNTNKLWDSIKTVVDMKASKKPLHANDEVQFANELNSFYQRFDAGDHRQQN